MTTEYYNFSTGFQTQHRRCKVTCITQAQRRRSPRTPNKRKKNMPKCEICRARATPGLINAVGISNNASARDSSMR